MEKNTNSRIRGFHRISFIAEIITYKKYFYETLKSQSFKDFLFTKILKFSEIFLKN